MEKLKNFFLGNISLILFSIFILSLIITSWLLKCEIINKENQNYIYWISLVIYIISNLAFNINKTERFLLIYMTQIIFLSLLFVIYYQFTFWINNNQLFIIIWWVFAFWYWYKRYERDKEIDIIEKYQMWKLTMENIDEIQKYRIWFLLNKKLYINDWIWDLIKQENEQIFFHFLQDNFMIRNAADKKKLGKIWKILSNILLPDAEFRNHILDLIKDIIKTLDNLKNELSDEEQNLKENLVLLIEVIEITNEKYKI
jgi:hypothetical protein